MSNTPNDKSPHESELQPAQAVYAERVLSGIEILLQIAASDAKFHELLLKAPEKAAEKIGLELDPMELEILQTTPREQLDAIISQTKILPLHYRTFFGISIYESVQVGGGVRPDLPRPKQPDSTEG